MLEAGDTGACAPADDAVLSAKPRRQRLPRPKRICYTAEAVDRLPFVVPGATRAEGRVLWAPRPSGDYHFDFTLGIEYAKALLPMLREPHGPALLGLIAIDILKFGRAGRDQGVVAGMFYELGAALQPRPGLRLVVSPPPCGDTSPGAA